MMSDTSVLFELPWPPSVNHTWTRGMKRDGTPNMRLSGKARAYRLLCSLKGSRRMSQYPLGTFPLPGRLSVVLLAHAPDQRRRDLDNLPKGVLDALQSLGVFRDDAQIDQITIVRGSPVPDGAINVRIDSLVPIPAPKPWDRVMKWEEIL